MLMVTSVMRAEDVVSHGHKVILATISAACFEGSVVGRSVAR